MKPPAKRGPPIPPKQRRKRPHSKAGRVGYDPRALRLVQR